MASSFPFITDEQVEPLLANGQMALACQEKDQDFDPLPVVKLFTPDAGATWLLTLIDPDDHDIAHGLCDLGLGFPEIGPVRLSELAEVRGMMKLPIARDLHFRAIQRLSVYAKQARMAGRSKPEDSERSPRRRAGRRAFAPRCDCGSGSPSASRRRPEKKKREGIWPRSQPHCRLTPRPGGDGLADLGCQRLRDVFQGEVKAAGQLLLGQRRGGRTEHFLSPAIAVPA